MLRRAFMAMAVLLALGNVPAVRAQSVLAQYDTSNPVTAYRAFMADMLQTEALFRRYQANPSYANQRLVLATLLRMSDEYLDLREVPVALRLKHGSAAIAYLADIFSRVPEYTGDPPTGDPPRWTLPGTRIRLIRVTEGPRTGSYVFSPETVANLRAWHDEIMSHPVLRAGAIPNWRWYQLRATGPMLSSIPFARLPESFQVLVLGIPAWKLPLILAAFAAALGTSLMWWRFSRRWAVRCTGWRHYAVQLTAPVVLAVTMLLALGFIMLEVNPTDLASDIVLVVCILFLYLAAAWGAWHAWWLMAEAVIAAAASRSRHSHVYDANLVRLVARVGSLLSSAALIMLGANDIGIPALGLLAGVSIGGVALALAAQSTVENLFGGVSIFADRPFRVGDTIEYSDGNGGVVVSIGPRSSRIRATDGRLTTVPNADLAKKAITNISARDRWTFDHRIPVARNTERARVLELLEDLQKRIAAHPSVAAIPGWPRVRLVAVTEAALEIEISAQILTREEAVFLEIQQELILQVIDALDRAGIEGPALPAIEAQAPRRDENATGGARA